MKEYILAVDDTAFPTKEKHYETLKTEESCFCSVAIKKELYNDLCSLMEVKTQELFKRFGTNEFHFTDMYNRRGAFKEIKLEQTLAYIHEFAQEMSDMGMIISVSTINKHSYKDPLQRKIINRTQEFIVPKLNMKKDIKSTNLILSIVRSQFTLKNEEDSKAKITEVYCDEGLRKAGASFELALSSGPVNITFAHSTNPLLQYADFSAWFLTRMKHILDKHPQNLKPWEEELLFIYSTMPYKNLKNVVYLIGNNKPFSYDKAIENLSKGL